jgi:hypothetical protein
LSEARQGIHTDDEQLEKINEIVSPLLKNGQSVNHIFSAHSNELNVCKNNYIDNCLLDAKTLICLAKSDTKTARKNLIIQLIINIVPDVHMMISRHIQKQTRILIMLKWIRLRAGVKKASVCLP